ncbi:glucose-6-phosphate isomerase [Campylobacter canadensis]|uniref:Glucose-6-phosphate isomerase n=1 Tax=Campylobacter canadensis TaxID=449520 RepID=A0ABS7WQW5_9BACT|nr:glucose-6-phosphate isomerase [Campylobacter canadensis]MBZ7987128.1 glucose-6-phosphate isomerase [Campylobacter canadensis]MBZ7994518.1 glucose-6-phosphate isomerase [Campylobacter canadensis]MBZ7997205.1 glucose-6-phosphate isomerase [Campylobacter canadensis]MBZ7998248.1 glucose-6-phosphate isomerase [Campylobacter canadensis]MBZ7999767.1 glucose-6-phosphate isomerase [Campylobacter canadensis]
MKHLKTYKKLLEHYEQSKNLHMRDLFKEDSKRAQRFFLEVGGIKLDYSKNRITNKTMELLITLAREAGLNEKIKEMFSGKKINTTEDRAVLHIALRNRINTPIFVDGKNIMDDVNNVLSKMANFTDEIRSGKWLGYTNQVITDIVNIGIGGSDLGPLMVCEALKKFSHPRIKMHFVSNIDARGIEELFANLNPQSTLFIISSKTFSTQETMTNALAAKEWFLSHAEKKEYIKKHFVAVSTNKEAVKEFGIDESNCFEFWNWVGGRYSLWSAIGLSIMIYLGKENFIQLLEGACLMDSHFISTPFENNMPVILALLGIWYINFYGGGAHIIAPYDEYLRNFPRFIQQLDMESNGKQVDKNGNKIDYESGPVVFGETGINAQHAFFQLLHQGTHTSPIDFIVSLKKPKRYFKSHDILISNLFAQAQAFMRGITKDEVLKELKGKLKEEDLQKVLPHKEFSGNRPSNIILLEELNPRNLGSLISLYEHKIFIQGVIWNINSFDQFGVELGKVLAKDILASLDEMSEEFIQKTDSSTLNLMQIYKKYNS